MLNLLNTANVNIENESNKEKHSKYDLIKMQ